MAGEVSYANHADLVVAAVLNQAIFELIADRVDLRHTVFFGDDPSGSGSAAVKIPQVQFDEKMAAVAEGADVANSTLGDGSVTLTVARQALRYDTTDLMQLVSNGKVNIPRLAAGIAMGAVRRASELICSAIDGFSNTAGATGVDWNVDYFYDAQFTIEEADVPSGPTFWVCKGKQWTQFQSSLRGEGGAVQFQGNTAELLAMKGQGFQGTFNGVDIWKSGQVQDDGTDIKGGMYVYGAVAGSEVTPELDNDKVPVSPFLSVAVDESAIWVELERSATGGLTKVVGNYYPAFGINEDARGVTTLSAL